ncbi:putative mucin TcMUCII [Trypanosoma cruzi]|nr:putative mucin TcMUCII [Trypanosoma cruzi]
MMTTCRLLCALLVLALCCCPSVCATDITPNEPQIEGNGASLPSTTSETKPKTQSPADTSPLPSPSEGEQEKGKAGPSGMVTASEEEDTARDGQTLNGPDSHSSIATSTLQSEGTDGTSGSQSRTSTAAEQATEEAKDSAQTTTTTTTTTKVPITSTTAPVAPTTTTTETPTTTTTRAPSRLREIDGSLSSSAWVCAPLLLAASALAYTTLD